MSRAKRVKKLNKNPKGRIITFILSMIFIALIIFSSIKIIKWLKENKQNTDLIENISNAISVDENSEEEQYIVDFESLKQTNSDVVAWLKVNGTSIKYPVVQTTNNDYYMTHSFDKSYNSAGWIFMNYKNNFDGTDKNIVIFAHNRKDGSMFGTLSNILTEELQEEVENHIITLITEDEYQEYQVFSVYQIEVEDYYIQIQFKNNEFSKFINTITKRSKKDFGITVSEEDTMLTLSTCANNNKYRVVLHAVRIK